MDANQIADQIEQINGQPLEEEQRLEIALWQRGRNLGSIPPHARDELQEMFEGYVRSDTDSLLAEEPANKDVVLAKHAIAHASARFLVRFLGDMNDAINAANKTPDVVKTGLRRMAPAESY